MEEEPPQKRGRPITRQEDWESTQKRLRLSTSTFERWRALKSTLALASDDAVVSYLLDFLALHMHRDECSTPAELKIMVCHRSFSNPFWYMTNQI